MKTTKQIATITLIILLAVIAYGLFRTSISMTETQIISGGEPSQAAHGSAIDQTPLFTAQLLAQMPTSPAEVALAQEAVRLGDREMDLAFAAGVGEAQVHPAPVSAEAKLSQARLQSAESLLDEDKARVTRLTAAVGKSTSTKEDSLEGQLEQAKVQVELDQDEADNAKQELILAGGDTQGRIEQLIKEHEAASRVADSSTINTAIPPDPHGLIHHYQRWSDLHDKTLLLRQAEQDAKSAAVAFTTQRDALESNIKTKTQEVGGTLVRGRTPPVDANPTAGTPETSAEFVSATKRRSAVMKSLTNSNERIEDQKRLAEAYGKWREVVAVRERAVVHSGLSGVAVIVAISLIGIFFDSWLKHILNRVRLDRRQADTLHAVIRTGLQIVALKDFIVSFVGWFVLMGRNGIRLGDWVEINGVTGEVVELGMFHTVLLETGNWTDSGHPTGRRVTFTNSFAIEGHYFNFSTSGQWLWDELTLVLASTQNPYPIVEAIQKTVLEATAEGAGQAEKEWQHAAHSRDMSALSAAPAVNVKPVSGGVEIAVRYITRANERYQMRSRLYQAAMNLISKKGGQEPSSIPAKQDPKPSALGVGLS